MGEASRRKHDVIHRHKLFDGRTDAVSLWRRAVLNGHLCGRCRTAKAIGTINMFWPAADFERDQPKLAVKYATECKGVIPTVKFRCHGDIRVFVAMPVIYFCQACQSEMERFAARAPSYVVAEVRTGPERDKLIGQVPGKIVQAG